MPPEAPFHAPLTGGGLDRAAGLRAGGDLSRLLTDPRAAAVVCRGDEVLVDPADPHRLARLPAPAGPPEELVLLGLEGGRPLFGLELAADREASFVALREAGLLLSAEESGLAAYLVALMAWHRGHPHCAVCGALTTLAEGGLSRRCPNCGATHFPRTDPVVIMLVEHEGRLLLGRRPGWPSGRYSLLAGFVAAGETPEEAVVREVREESGILAAAPRYLGSQPWPFPASLMLGFAAVSDGGTPQVQDGELEDVAWFARPQVEAARDPGSALQLPPSVSIARVLIDGWLDGRWGGSGLAR